MAQQQVPEEEEQCDDERGWIELEDVPMQAAYVLTHTVLMSKHYLKGLQYLPQVFNLNLQIHIGSRGVPVWFQGWDSR